MTTVLFRAHGRRGLGHLMRGLNIARELRTTLPGVEIMVHTRTAGAAVFCPPGVQLVPDGPGTGWAATLHAVAPDVVVYDTMLPAADAEPLPPGTRCVYVLRRMRPERYAQVLADPFLRRVDHVIVPHTAAEFGSPPPAGVATTFVGPIVRLVDPATLPALRRRHGIADGDLVVTATAGGGGFAESAGSLFATVAQVHRLLHGRVPRLRHLLVTGPNCATPPPELPGLTVIGCEPDLVGLFALSDLVVAEAGYNTVQELRAAGIPAALLPGARALDDQHERAAELARTGGALVIDGPPDPARRAARIAALATSPARLARLRASAGHACVEPGNAAAARIVAGLAGNVRAAG